MADFNWDELPEQAEESKKAKRDTLTAEEIPAAIHKLAAIAAKSGKFHYQPLPTKGMAADFAKFIRAAGDFTDPQVTILAKEVSEWIPPGKKAKVKVTRGAVIRYSAGERRGRKPDAEATDESGESDEGTESE